MVSVRYIINKEIMIMIDLPSLLSDVLILSDLIFLPTRKNFSKFTSQNFSPDLKDNLS